VVGDAERNGDIARPRQRAAEEASYSNMFRCASCRLCAITRRDRSMWWWMSWVLVETFATSQNISSCPERLACTNQLPSRPRNLVHFFRARRRRRHSLPASIADACQYPFCYHNNRARIPSRDKATEITPREEKCRPGCGSWVRVQQLSL
jgi:hypothetical protein